MGLTPNASGPGHVARDNLKREMMMTIRYRIIPRSPEYPHQWVGGEVVRLGQDGLPIGEGLITGSMVRIVRDLDGGMVAVRCQGEREGIEYTVDPALIRVDVWREPEC